MKLINFIKMQNREMVENANIAFKLFLPEDMGGKWFFYCNEGETLEDLCRFVEEHNINIDIVWPYNSVEIEEDGEDANGNVIYKYIFNLTE